MNKYDTFEPFKNFIDCNNKAALRGKILALILASKLFLKFQSDTLICFSLGAHVTKNCIKQMNNLHYKEHIPCNDIITNIVFIAGTTSFLKKTKSHSFYISINDFFCFFRN